MAFLFRESRRYGTEGRRRATLNAAPNKEGRVVIVKQVRLYLLETVFTAAVFNQNESRRISSGAD